MKSAVFALLLVVAGAFAFPQFDNPPRPGIEDRIRNVIERISQRIQDAGYDPLIIESAQYEKQLAEGVIEIFASCNELKFRGASTFDINNLQYYPIINRLTFDISMPEIYLSIGNAAVNARFFQSTLDAQLSGSLAIRGMRLAGEINLNISIIGGIDVRSITMDFFGGNVESKLTLDINGRNYSDILNRILGVRIPDFMEDNRNEINRGLEIMMRVFIENFYN